MKTLYILVICLLLIGIGISIYQHYNPKIVPSIQYSAPIGPLQNGDILPSHKIKSIPIEG
jgi:hypothetical protein